MTGQLRETLVELGGAMPPARLTPDVWRRGRRARRRSRWLRAGAAAAVVALVVALAPWSQPPKPESIGDGDSAVPRTVGVPYMWQATAQMDAPGPASVVFGGDTIGLRGTDWFDSEGKLAVVGRDSGKTRTLLYGGVDDITAGEDVLLSPDGRRVASPHLDYSDAGPGLVVTDLSTGKSRRYRGGINEGGDGEGCCAPVAWAPDGRSLIAVAYGKVTFDDTGLGRNEERLVLLDLDTDRVTPLAELRSGNGVRHASRAAWLPDGRRFLVSLGATLRMMDRSGAIIWSVDLGPRRHLGGIGAVDRSGTRIAVVDLDGCLDVCDTKQLSARSWTIRFLDVDSGLPVTATPEPTVAGMAVRVLGWTDDGELVVLRHTPERGARKEKGSDWDDTDWYTTGHVTLLGVRPDGATRTLLDPPDGVLTIDVPDDLLRAGRFGGPPSVAEPFPARPIILVVIVPVLIPLLVILVVIGLVVRRLRR